MQPLEDLRQFGGIETLYIKTMNIITIVTILPKLLYFLNAIFIISFLAQNST